MPSQRHNNNMLWLGLSDVSEKIGLISVTAVCRNHAPELDWYWRWAHSSLYHANATSQNTDNEG